MHGLINRTIQCFVRDTYGSDTWAEVAQVARLDPPGFEAMLSYEDGLTDDVLGACAQVLDRARDQVLEDIGTYLVSHPHTGAVRRLLRFGGVTYIDFLHSLDELPERARLAVADLDLPALELADLGEDRFGLRICGKVGFGHVMMGLMRALADDYGALVFLDYGGRDGGVEHLNIQVFEARFAEENHFDLGAGTGGGNGM